MGGNAWGVSFKPNYSQAYDMQGGQGGNWVKDSEKIAPPGQKKSNQSKYAVYVGQTAAKYSESTANKKPGKRKKMADEAMGQGKPKLAVKLYSECIEIVEAIEDGKNKCKREQLCVRWFNGECKFAQSECKKLHVRPKHKLAEQWEDMCDIPYKNLHTLYSNRSAAHLVSDQFKEAEADGDKCIELNPDWPKGYLRKGKAQCARGGLEGKLEEFEAGIATFKLGLEKDEGNEDLLAAVELATSTAADLEKELKSKKRDAPEGDDEGKSRAKGAAGGSVGGGGDPAKGSLEGAIKAQVKESVAGGRGDGILLVPSAKKQKQ